MITIRKATPDDIDAVVAIEREGLRLWDRGQFLAEFRFDFSDFIVIEELGSVSGFAVSWNIADEIQLNNIGISPGRRNRGLGTALMNRIMAPPDRRVLARKVVLEVSVSNIPAIKFYEKLGFVPNGHRKNFYRDGDALLMEKIVSC